MQVPESSSINNDNKLNDISHPFFLSDGEEGSLEAALRWRPCSLSLTAGDVPRFLPSHGGSDQLVGWATICFRAMVFCEFHKRREEFTPSAFPIQLLLSSHIIYSNTWKRFSPRFSHPPVFLFLFLFWSSSLAIIHSFNFNCPFFNLLKLNLLSLLSLCQVISLPWTYSTLNACLQATTSQC